MNVLIIGANSTVARATMQAYLAKHGEVKFCCMVRDTQKFQQWQGEQTVQLQQSIAAVIAFDALTLTAKQAEQQVAEAVLALGYIDMCLVAHGYLGDQLLSERDASEIQRSFSINCVSVLHLLVPLVQQLQAQARQQQISSKLAVITSVAGVRGRPRNFTYGAAKGAVSIWLQGLRSALRLEGLAKHVEVYDIKLGPVDTPMTIDHEKNFSFTSPNKVAASIVRVLNSRSYNAYVPSFWRWVLLTVQLMPEWLFQRLGFLSDR